MGAIMQGLRNAPNAIYPLVQTVLLQDEALKQADAHIRALEGGNSASDTSSAGNTSFLGGMRDALFGRGESRGGSVPSVRPGGMGRYIWVEKGSARPSMRAAKLKSSTRPESRIIVLISPSACS